MVNTSGNNNQIISTTALNSIPIMIAIKPIHKIKALTEKPIILIMVLTINEEKYSPISMIDGLVSSCSLFHGENNVDNNSFIEKKLNKKLIILEDNLNRSRIALE